jgi:hypothetical protein
MVTMTRDTPLELEVDLAAARGHLAVVKYIIPSAEEWVDILLLAAINNNAEITPLGLERASAIYREQHDVVEMEYRSNLQDTKYSKSPIYRAPIYCVPQF